MNVHIHSDEEMADILATVQRDGLRWVGDKPGGLTRWFRAPFHKHAALVVCDTQATYDTLMSMGASFAQVCRCRWVGVCMERGQ